MLESHVLDITRLIQLAVAPVFLTWSIALAVTAALFVCLLIGFAFVSAFVAIDLSRTVASLFIVSMIALTICLLLFLREVFLAALTVRHPPALQAALDERK